MLDPKTKELDCTTAHLFINDSNRKMGLVLENIIPILMKDTDYNSKISFIIDTIITTSY